MGGGLALPTVTPANQPRHSVGRNQYWRHCSHQSNAAAAQGFISQAGSDISHIGYTDYHQNSTPSKKAWNIARIFKLRLYGF